MKFKHKNDIKAKLTIVSKKNILKKIKKFLALAVVSACLTTISQKFSEAGVTEINADNKLNFTHSDTFPLNILGRCHMMYCWYVQILNIKKTDVKSGQITGTRVTLKASSASLSFPPDGEYPAGDPIDWLKNATWDEPYSFEIFCSFVKPAFRSSYTEGEKVESWKTIDPTVVHGVTEGIINIYYKICHYKEQIDINSISQIAHNLGYSVNKEFYKNSNEYTSFDELIEK